MPDILHCLSIDAPPERVHDLAATREGIQRWWTGHPVAGEPARPAPRYLAPVRAEFPFTRRRGCSPD
jgi:uncharacterized protein YndB with AHSA1/START domain